MQVNELVLQLSAVDKVQSISMITYQSGGFVKRFEPVALINALSDILYPVEYGIAIASEATRSSHQNEYDNG